jgi:hypothetical protein
VPAAARSVNRDAYFFVVVSQLSAQHSSAVLRDLVQRVLWML